MSLFRIQTSPDLLEALIEATTITSAKRHSIEQTTSGSCRTAASGSRWYLMADYSQTVRIGDQIHSEYHRIEPGFQKSAAVIHWLKTAAFDYSGRRLTLGSIWFQDLRAGEYTSLHDHKGWTLSGVLFLKVPEQICLANEPDGWIEFAEKDETERILPREGECFLFESDFKHVVYPFRGEGIRRSMSFNLGP